MKLSRFQKNKSDKRMMFILSTFERDVEEAFRMELAACIKCQGSGLSTGINKMWDTHSYCDICKGDGYFYKEENMLNSRFCPKCEGAGCNDCENKGLVDWVKFARISEKKTSRLSMQRVSGF